MITVHMIRIDKYNSNDDDCVPLPFTLRSLNLSSSVLLCDVIRRLCGTKLSLKILNASHQKDIDGIDLFWKVLKNLDSVEILDLSENNFRKLTGNLFSELRKLTCLNLADNLLMEISIDVNPLTSLKLLDPTGNTIQFASEECTVQIQVVAKETDITIYLSDNRLVCDCERQYLVSWLMDTNVVFEKNNITWNFKMTQIWVWLKKQKYFIYWKMNASCWK